MSAAGLIVLPLPVRPLGGETVSSYLHRLAMRNGVSPDRLARMVGAHPDTTEAIAALSGLDPRTLPSALPQLRPGFPDDADRASRRCPACTWCALAARAGPATVLAAPDRVVCRRHRRWIGGPVLACRADQQFDCASIPAMMAAGSRHHGLAAQWGLPGYGAAFAESIHTLGRAQARGLLVGHGDQAINDRRRLLASAAPNLSGTALDILAWYPATVAHTAAILRRRHSPKATPTPTRDGLEYLTHVT
ncbi:TniQ family protein [Nocardia sp. NPDC127606]|uniref:TniQ family protein n=1 Tax=Nocardia sp. NPDC127606 TaxID=3345406 RepID=UPI0036441650